MNALSFQRPGDYNPSRAFNHGPGNPLPVPCNLPANRDQIGSPSRQETSS